MTTVRLMTALAALIALGCGGAKNDDEPSPAPEPVTTPADGAAAVAPPTPADAAVAAVMADAAAAATGDGSGTGHGSGTGGGNGSGGGDGTAEDDGPPKNLKVLSKSWSRDKVKAYMKTISKQLGVKCKHCHEGKDYAADNDKKELTREMMRMTTDVNKRFFKGKPEVSCYTCHLGQAEPPK